MDDIKKLLNCTGFQWDKGNIEKNWLKHKVSPVECEQMFFNQPVVAAEDLKHSQKEKRYYALGQTDDKRLLFVAFTFRRNFVRVISARDMSQKERKSYEENQ
ncbi:MAG: BrnT family toxin [Planctomycetes bacterium]|nr:BrnT family toxin [Planctomycetota bacterium]MCK5472521.1 BrnT family toxin [Planctomycetota bacterium]